MDFPHHTVVLRDEIRITVEILVKAEKCSSVRNEFYKFLKKASRKRNDRRKYNSIYHYIIEVIKRKNWLDEILKIQKITVSGSDTFSYRLLNLYRVCAYLLHIQSYTSQRPTINQLKSIAKHIFHYLPENKIIIIFKDLEKLSQFALATWDKNNYNNVTRLSLIYFQPEWMINYLSTYWNTSELEKFLQTINNTKIQWIRTLKPPHLSSSAFNQQLLSLTEKDGLILKQDHEFSNLYSVIQTKNIPLALSQAYKKHYFIIQSKISSIIGYLVDPQPGNIILDMAAAPGMKSSLLAELLVDGLLICNDISKRRIRTILTHSSISTSNSVTLTVADAGGTVPLPFQSKIFDRVLLDAPCSSTGISWLYPDHKWHSPSKILAFSALQKQLFKECLRVLKPGGTGVYSVCSIHSLEGEQIIEEYLADIELVEPLWGRKNSCYPYDDKHILFSEDITRFCRRTFPHIDQTDSFFIAKFKKRPDRAT